MSESDQVSLGALRKAEQAMLRHDADMDSREPDKFRYTIAHLIDEAEQRGYERGVQDCATMARQGAVECEDYVEEHEPLECGDEYTEEDRKETHARLDASTYILRSFADSLEELLIPQNVKEGG